MATCSVWQSWLKHDKVGRNACWIELGKLEKKFEWEFEEKLKTFCQKKIELAVDY